MARISNSSPVLDDKLLKKAVLKRNKDLSDQNKYLAELISDDKKTSKKLEKIVTSLTLDGEHLEGQVKDAKDLLKKQVTKYKAKKKSMTALEKESDSLTGKNKKADHKLKETLKLVVKEEAKSLELSQDRQSLNVVKSELTNLKMEKHELSIYIENLVAEGKIEAKKYTYKLSAAKKKHDKACVLLDKEGADLAEATKIMREGHESLKKDLKAVTKASADKIAKVTAYIKRETQSIEDSILDLKGESAAIQSEINESMARLNVERQNLVDMEESKELALIKTQAAKDDYDAFKVNCFEEMAALKLRGRLEKIDKAGLGDVFKQ
jgi:hypothetical protein